MPELVLAARWKVAAWSEILFALASPLPEREAWSHSLSPRSPGASVGKAQHAAPGEEKEPLAMGWGNAREAG